MPEEKDLRKFAEEIYNSRMQKIRENEFDLDEYIRCILEIFSASIDEASDEEDMIFCLSIKCTGRKLKSAVLLQMPEFGWLEADDISTTKTKEALRKVDDLKGDINTLSALSEKLKTLPHIDAFLVGENYSKLFIRQVN